MLNLVVLATCFGACVSASENTSAVYEARSDISQLVYRWGFYRDHGMWEELIDTFHAGGEIHLTWYSGKFEGFVDASKEMAGNGVSSSHVMKPPIIHVAGDRAIAMTPASITARANPGVELDVTSNAYFFDFIERRSGEWKISRRVCVYQKDRIDSVLPSIKFWFMSWFIDIDKYDPAYKFLAAGLERQGFEIQPGQIIDNTAESRALYAQGLAWINAERKLQ